MWAASEEEHRKRSAASSEARLYAPPRGRVWAGKHLPGGLPNPRVSFVILMIRIHAKCLRPYIGGNARMADEYSDS